MKRRIPSALLAGGFLASTAATRGVPRFPPPDFESGYTLPATLTPGGRQLIFQYLDVAVLLAALALACYFIFQKRSRKAVAGLSLFSLLYFGFYRQGCICSIGSVQNVALGLVNSTYAIPLTALAFFMAPLVVALFAGRAFCASVCPHGALQDLVLLKPVKIPLWLEHSLGLVPLIYLGAAVTVAATGSTFLICRYDPFVPIFRRTGSASLLIAGGVLLALGIFVGRPYCRFLCPYGALLKMAASVSKWRVRITPTVCTQCRLCEASCPYGAIQEPLLSPLTPTTLRADRRRLGWLVLLLPTLIAGGAWVGGAIAPFASKLNPTVAVAERLLDQQTKPAPLASQTAPSLALSRAQQEPEAALSRALALRGQFVHAGWIFGGWTGLVIGLKLISLTIRRRRPDYQADRGACLACARCFADCPNDRLRAGLLPSASAEDCATAERTRPLPAEAPAQP